MRWRAILRTCGFVCSDVVIILRGAGGPYLRGFVLRALKGLLRLRRGSRVGCSTR